VLNILVGLLFSITALGQPAFLKEGLVAYYPFNGNANDESGNSRNGQVPVGGPNLTFNRFGQTNSAYSFSGANGGITVPESLHPTGSNPDLTGVFWVKAPYSDLLRVAVGVTSYSTGSGSACGMTANGILLYSIHSGENYFTNSPYQPQTWSQIAYSKVGRTVSFYINGIKVGSAVSGSTYITSKNLYIGWNGNFSLGNGQQWIGVIDDVSIYNRALSDAEVKSLYEYESTPPNNSFITNGLVAYYPFNGNANDESQGATPGKFLPGASLSNDYLSLKGNSVMIDGVNGLNKGVFIEKPVLNVGDINYCINIWFNSNSEEKRFQTLFNTTPHEAIGIQFNREGDRKLGLALGIGDAWKTGFVYSKTAAKIGQWNMATLTKTGDEFKLFVNGINEVTLKLTTTGVNKPVSMWLGSVGPIFPGALYPGEVFAGQLDNIRIYKRSLSEGEVKALYDYESTPQPLNPWIATATAQVVNGFVVGATITDGGYGYVSNPVVAITGGGGTGAKATATQFNGIVTSITITNPGSGYTSTPTITIAPPPFPPRKATSTAQVVNGFVVGTKITDGGFGYDSPPAVLIVGGGGSGATAVATVANGVVTAITISNPGTGYTSSPIVRIASPPFAPKLAIETSKVFVRMSVVLGRKYQLEASTDLNTWTSSGPAFIAQDEELVQEFDVNQVGRYFRINQVP
jgi:hypothetical protein